MKTDDHAGTPSLAVDKIRIDGSEKDGKVHMYFANIAMALDPETARQIAFALMGQADRAERELPEID